MADVFKKLVYENASGARVLLSEKGSKHCIELRRSGFTAPDVNLITQSYIGGRTKLLRSIRQPRHMTVTLLILGETQAQKDRVFHEMITKLMDVSGGEEGRLYITRSDGSEVYSNCCYASGLNVEEEYQKYQRFTLEFYAADWAFYNEAQNQTFRLVADDPITLADDLYLGNWHLGDGVTTGYATINNTSGLPIDPVIEVGGVRTDLLVVNLTTGKSIELTDLEMSSGDTIVIDTRKAVKAVYLRRLGSENVNLMNKLNWANVSLTMPIVTGENVIRVNSTQGVESTVKLIIESTYLSA